jgi:flagellar M-ring protein FliF
MTVAVMVDGVTTSGPDGTPVWSALPDAELEALRELVGSAVGLDTSRGDVLTLRSMPFEAPPEVGTLAEPGLFGPIGPIDPMMAIQIGVLFLLAVVLGIFVLRPLLLSRRAPAGEPVEAPLLALPGVGPARGSGGDRLPVLTGEISDDDPAGLALVSDRADQDAQPEDPVERLRRLIDARRDESVQILRGWMETEEERR